MSMLHNKQWYKEQLDEFNPRFRQGTIQFTWKVILHVGCFLKFRPKAKLGSCMWDHVNFEKFVYTLLELVTVAGGNVEKASGQEATVDILSVNTVLTLMFQDKWTCWGLGMTTHSHLRLPLYWLDLTLWNGCVDYYNWGFWLTTHLVAIEGFFKNWWSQEWTPAQEFGALEHLNYRTTFIQQIFNFLFK